MIYENGGGANETPATILKILCWVETDIRKLEVMGERLRALLHPRSRGVRKVVPGRTLPDFVQEPWPWTDGDSRKLKEAAEKEKAEFVVLLAGIEKSWTEVAPRLIDAAGRIQATFPTKERWAAKDVLAAHDNLKRTVERGLPRCRTAMDGMLAGRRAAIAGVRQWLGQLATEGARDVLRRLDLAELSAINAGQAAGAAKERTMPMQSINVAGNMHQTNYQINQQGASAPRTSITSVEKPTRRPIHSWKRVLRTAVIICGLLTAAAVSITAVLKMLKHSHH